MQIDKNMLAKYFTHASSSWYSPYWGEMMHNEHFVKTEKAGCLLNLIPKDLVREIVEEMI